MISPIMDAELFGSVSIAYLYRSTVAGKFPELPIVPVTVFTPSQVGCMVAVGGAVGDGVGTFGAGVGADVGAFVGLNVGAIVGEGVDITGLLVGGFVTSGGFLSSGL
jgi:hypothetical protein